MTLSHDGKSKIRIGYSVRLVCVLEPLLTRYANGVKRTERRTMPRGESRIASKTGSK